MTQQAVAEHASAGQPAALGAAELAGLGLERLRSGGHRRIEALGELGVGNVLELLTYYPRRYLDRSREATLDEMQEGDDAMVRATVQQVVVKVGRNRRKRVEATVSDETGAWLRCTFFNQTWRERQLRAAEDSRREIVLFGRLEFYGNTRQMVNPVVDIVGDRTGAIFGIYPLSAKAQITTWEIADMVAEALRRCEHRGIDDPVPAPLLAEHGLPNRFEALRLIHSPESFADVTRARNRLVFDELLRMQVALLRRKRHREVAGRGIAHRVDEELLAGFRAQLPFQLTASQERSVAEILADLQQPWPMHRLLQGEVASGKTIVALLGMLAVVGGGGQAALMAPTEVLAEQHYLGLRRMLDLLTPTAAAPAAAPQARGGGKGRLALGGLPRVNLALLTSRSRAAARQRTLTALAAGDIDLVVGTHALIGEEVSFAALGLAVVDEQHRFGVEQRALLRRQGTGAAQPDVLVMTATPIPRTAALTVYGDLDTSRLDELPKGRAGVQTEAVTEEADEHVVWERLRAEVGAGRQGYVVCPLIEESEKVGAASAEEIHADLQAGELAGLRLELLHGRLRPDDRERIMAGFRRGESDVLVATTVIEVGVDVANATVMVILGADRFGIAQLHQLRGRVGRGSEPGWCFLVSHNPPEHARRRMEALVECSDGFELSEIDLELRGEGTLMDSRQTGRSDLNLASLRRDKQWVERARDAATEILDAGGPSPALAAEVDMLWSETDVEFFDKI